MNAQKRYAIVVGVNEYEPDFHALKYAKNDATRLNAILQDKACFGQETSYLLVSRSDADADHQVSLPTRTGILDKVQYVCKSAGPDDLILFYFAGHGAEISKIPYLVASDTRMNVLDQTAVNVNDLNSMFEATRAKCVVRIFDACRSPFGSGRGDLGRMTAALDEAVIKCGSGWVSFSSCSSGEISHESPEWEQGVFSYHLCAGLEGKAADDNGQVTFESLVHYVKISVSNWCDQQTQRQTPHFQADLSGSLVLGTVREKMPQTPPTPGSPFDALHTGLDTLLSQAKPDTRRLTYTGDSEFKEIAELVARHLEEQLRQLSDPTYSAKIQDPRPFQECAHGEWTLFHHDMQQQAIQPEFTRQTKAFDIRFQSSEMILPSTSLCIALVRFNFFYWIWYCHTCVRHQQHGTFEPDPQIAKGFFTFKPSGARDAARIEETAREVFVRASDQLIEWANQLSAYVDARIEPLRKMGDVIE